MAETLCEGLRRHDNRDRSGSVDAFHYVDARQFAHLSESESRAAAEAYVDGLWRKDEVEQPYASDGRIVDLDGLAQADWSPVVDELERRARIVGMDPAYATLTTDSWKRHKVGGDYWTPILHAQKIECAVAFAGDRATAETSTRPDAIGHLPARYLVGVELHDLHTEGHWHQAVEIMTPYFEAILDSHDGPGTRDS